MTAGTVGEDEESSIDKRPKKARAAVDQTPRAVLNEPSSNPNNRQQQQQQQVVRINTKITMSSQQLQYRPTTLERAYASHLLQTYFQTPPTPNSDTTPLRVSGRQAVPFLTTSGVERTLLRLLWSVADPEAVGTLVIRNQFHVLLRLVAMAQAHFLPPLTTTAANNDDGRMTDADKIEILTNTLRDNSHLVIALPTFSADTSCPSVAYLLGTFSSVVTAKENSMLDYSNNSGNNIGGNNVDVSSMLTNHDLQYQLWQQQQQQQQNQQQQDNSQGGEQNNNMMSVSDAFGSLPEVEDRPLPPLKFDTPTTTPAAAVEDVKSLPLSTVVDNGDVNGEGELNNDMEEVSDEGFGDFDDSNNPMQTTNEGMGSDDVNPTSSTAAAAAAAVVENDEADFGGFESTPNNYNNDSDVKTESSADDDSNEAENADDAGFGNFSDSFPPPVPAMAEMTLSENNAAQDSVANTTEQTPEIALGNSVGNTLSISDAFGSLVNQEDPPIQFGEMNAFEGVAGDANVVNESDYVEEEDDFGNFGSADTTAAAVPVVEETKGHNNEDFNEGPTASSAGMSVFDAFGDVEDKPLPLLGGFPSIANETTAPNAEEAEIDDDGFGFGSFEATVEAEPSNDDAPGDDNFGTFEGAAVTTTATEENVDAPVEDSFGTFEDAAEETADSIDPINDSHVEDSFGTFEGVGGEGDIVEIEENTDSHAEFPAITPDFPSPSQSDPFGSLPEVENLPLPPLTSPFLEEKKSLEAPKAEEEEDDFGDFDSPGAPDAFLSPHSEVDNSEQMVVSNEDNFGGFESTAVAVENNAEIESNNDATESPDNDASPEITSSEQSFPTPAIDTDSVPFSEEKKSHDDADIGGVAAASLDEVVGEEPKPSYDLSAFDAFGDIEDAPLPPLNGFAPSANNEIEAAETGDMEVNNDESFGTFGMVETKPNADAPADDSFGTFADAAISTVETPNVDTPVEDSFGTFEGVGEETAEPEPVVDDSFGTFEGVAHETGQAEGSVNAPVEDSFGTFEGVAEETAETRPTEVETLVENSFETFEGVGGEEETAEKEQNIALQTQVPAISFGLPSPSPSDPFGSLPEVENLPLPPLTSPPFVERKLEDVALEVEENTPDSENDDFGDFGSVPVDDGSCDVLHLESKQMDEDDFGGFESTTPQVQANEDVFGSATDNTNDNTSSARSEVENDVDDFGDFGEAQVSAPPLDTASMAIDAAENANNIVDTEDDFGDFGEAQVPAPPLDDFGDFGEAQVSAPPLDTASMDIDAAANANNTDDTDDDFGFGDWGSGDWQGQAPEGNESASALVPDILSGGFDAFSDPAPESTAIAATDEQATPTTPNGEYDDEFGSFEAPESGVTQDEGSEGFVFVENTEPNSQFDAFGDFSSPASESFSAFDSGANEDKIMPPKLEEDNADGFGDFSSFDNGAQQLEEVKEGSQKISLSRQELIGSEYTNLMERWATIIFKSSKLQNHVLGLAEFVRVVRCIAATIADVFCLSDSIDLQASHLPEWNDNPIIADAITIETLWSEINSRVIELGVLPRPPQLETVVEIRGRANIATVQQKTDLCHLTLQPFVDKPCTQSSVDWNGHKYMACAANLLLHRMS
ncbi:hypothetical protein QTG54_002823 [Skeletonema marinoi]|uniref:Uncharacterized protein n=1 Tax=Skeletonema marinoi TaxID=267567 RepID=A0AAD9DFW4_9STRA|nr:hypothetical protein QTG54_002823 [Skeletonema marinoi]